jgi:mono/diheme cytochrome c family protein
MGYPSKAKRIGKDGSRVDGCRLPRMMLLWHHTDEVLFRITKYGAGAYLAGHQTDMPAFNERLTDEQIASALAFIKSTWPAELREKQLRIEAKSRGLAR